MSLNSIAEPPMDSSNEDTLSQNSIAELPNEAQEWKLMWSESNKIVNAKTLKKWVTDGLGSW